MMRRKEKKSFRESTWMNRTIWALWVFAFGVLYMIHGNDAAAAAVLMALIYPAVAFLSVNLSGRRLKVEFGGGGSAEKSRDIPMEIRLKNESRIPVSRLRFRIQMENRITGEEQSISAAVSLGSGGEATERFTICDPYCGCERIRIRDAEICDGAGLVARHIRLEEYTDAVVLPSIETIGIPEHFLDSYDMESYHYSSRRPGEDPGEVFGIREYQSGDSLRAVHWKLSAKMNDLMVKIPVGVAYGEDVEKVRNVIVEAIKPLCRKTSDGRDLVHPKKDIIVAFSDFGPSSVDLLVCVWMLVEKKILFTAQLKEAIYDALKKHDIEIPFPQLDVNVKNPV